jgi:glycosyltransferase involved in cell wall biosynthesis
MKRSAEDAGAIAFGRSRLVVAGLGVPAESEDRVAGDMDPTTSLFNRMNAFLKQAIDSNFQSAIMQLFRRVVRFGSRTANCPQVPTFSLRPSRAAVSPTLWFICPDFQKPSGGTRKLYRCVDILNNAGLNAAIVHSRSGFRCNWFQNETRVVAARDTALTPADIMVVPEIYGHSIRSLPSGIRQVIFNQNVYNTLNLIKEAPIHASPYTTNPELAFVVVVSQDNAEVLNSLFPAIQIRRLQLGIDPALYHLPSGPKQRRIAYMPRKRPLDAKRVIQRLKRAKALTGWEAIVIDGHSEIRAAELLRSSKVFLSFSKQEGFGLPPLEALACGCAVVGYHGSGGREFFRPPFATAIGDGDTPAFAAAVQTVLRDMDEDPRSSELLASAANRFVLEHYTIEKERQNVIEIFAPLLQ